MTHLHLRRASSPQPASCTFSLSDDPNFERLCRLDGEQVGGGAANPVGSPQPVVGIHFEGITGEELIVIPSCFLNSLREPHIHLGSSARAHTGAAVSPNLAKFTQLSFQELAFSGGSVETASVWSSSGPAQFSSSHGDAADDAGSKLSRSVVPERHCHLLSVLCRPRGYSYNPQRTFAQSRTLRDSEEKTRELAQADMTKAAIGAETCPETRSTQVFDKGNS